LGAGRSTGRDPARTQRTQAPEGKEKKRNPTFSVVPPQKGTVQTELKMKRKTKSRNREALQRADWSELGASRW